MKAFFILSAGALLCYLVAAVYPGTSTATVFSVICAGFMAAMLFLDLVMVVSTFLFILGVRLEENAVHYNLTMSRNPLPQAIFNIVLNVATAGMEVWVLFKLWDMV